MEDEVVAADVVVAAAVDGKDSGRFVGGTRSADRGSERMGSFGFLNCRCRASSTLDAAEVSVVGGGGGSFLRGMAARTGGGCCWDESPLPFCSCMSGMSRQSRKDSWLTVKLTNPSVLSR